MGDCGSSRWTNNHKGMHPITVENMLP
uniref:Uncharacterized protein n=1 Tax=Arundo donax TaxID=35708 RepID=A0A0A9C203_ARUDO